MTSSLSLKRNQHEIIRASAGSGKTYQLSSRYIRLLFHGAQPPSILATTFTRKAAGEIQQTVLMRLAQAAANKNAAAQLAHQLDEPSMDLDNVCSMLQQMVNNLDQIMICTIDSFFYQLAMNLRHDLAIPLQVVIMTNNEPQAIQLQLEAINQFLNHDEPQVLLDLLRRLHPGQAQYSVTHTINKIIGKLLEVFHQAPTEKAWKQLQTTGTVNVHISTQDIDVLQKAGDMLTPKKWKDAWSKNLAAAKRQDWEAFLTTGLTARIATGDGTYYKKPIPQEVIDAYQPAIHSATTALVAETSRRTQAMYQLLSRFSVHHDHLCQQHNRLLYGDLTRKLAAFVPTAEDHTPTIMSSRLDRRFDHLMLDEFQDTSIEQWHILRPFADQIRHRKEKSSKSQTFFCVGDTKQAIYGWRGGCAEIFDQVENDLKLPTKNIQQLNTSFRSSPVILNAVNLVFDAVGKLPDSLSAFEMLKGSANEWSHHYKPHEAQYKTRPGHVTLATSASRSDTTNPTGDDDLELAYTPSPHQSMVTNLIAQLHTAAPNRSLGVLVRDNKMVKRLIDLLRRLELNASGEGGGPLNDDPAIGTVLSALKMADHPGDTAAAFCVLHSPLAISPGIQLTNLDTNSLARTSRSIRQHLSTCGYGQTIAQWTRHLAPACNQRSLTRLIQLIDLANRYDTDRKIRPDDFVQYVERSSIQEPTGATIRVMTIHQAKGLEFDIVVLPQLNEVIASLKGTDVWAYRPAPTEPPQAIFAKVGDKLRPVLAEHCDLVDKAYNQEKSRRFHDDLCSLYVAMTRARHALHMVIEPLRKSKTGKPTRHGQNNLSYASILRHSLHKNEEGFEFNQTLYQAGDPKWYKSIEDPSSPITTDNKFNMIQTGPIVFSEKPSHPFRNLDRRTPSKQPNPISISDLFNFEKAGDFVRGRMIHAWLQQISWLNPSPQNLEGVPSKETLWTIAKSFGHNHSDTWVAQQIADFLRTLSKSTMRQAFAQPSGESENIDLWRERRFAVMQNHVLIHGTFDRVVIYRDHHGQARRADLIDFKTDQSPRLVALAENYRSQIDVYRSALMNMLQLNKGSVHTSLMIWPTGQIINL